MVLVAELEKGAYFYVVPNAEWSKEYLPSPPVEGKFTRVHITVTGTNSCRNRTDCVAILQDIKQQHMKLGQPNINYNFMIGTYGTIYEGRGWEFLPHLSKESAAAAFDKPRIKFDPSAVKNCLQIAYIGSYISKGDQLRTPNFEMMSAVLSLLKYGMKNEYIDTNYQIDFYTPPKMVL